MKRYIKKQTRYKSLTSAKKSRASKSLSRPALTILAFVSLIFLGALFMANKNKPNSPPDTNQINEASRQEPPKAAESKTSSLDLAAVGDMLPHETITQSAKTGSGYDYLSLISPELQASFKKADLRFCNQEAPSAASLGVRGYPAFNAPAQFPKDLSKFGCNIISTGNNHSSDGGQTGINGTLEEWDSLSPLAVSGSNRSQQEADKLQIFEKNGIKIGFVAFSQDSNSSPANTYSVNRLSNTKLLESQIKGLKSAADVVIVSAHWGTEDSHTVDSLQKKYAQQIADFGADIILGSGPHVWQPYTELTGSTGNKTHTWYSIGNGLNSQTKADQLFSGVALLKLTKSAEGKVEISSPRVLPTYMHYTWSNGVGLAQSQLLGRRDLKWMTLVGSDALISDRNDFQTTVPQQFDKLKKYLENDKVELLQAY
ncbi:MAG: hypothetical protein QG623_288 [Patescibacteria group bacterium]|nr:hypothetical protein [Patescibacteria group bacterium]